MFLSKKAQERMVVENCQEEVNRLLKWGCEEVGMAHVYPNIEVVFSTSMRTTMGRAYTDFENEGGRIKLCIKLFARATEAQTKRTTLHELAHILANLRAGRQVHHGGSWKRMMIRLGLAPDRCHSVDTKGVRRKNRRFIINCERGCALTVTSSKLTRMKKALLRGQTFWCRRCGFRAYLTQASLDAAKEVRPSLPEVR